MYINPILFGVLCTVVGEIVIIFAVAIIAWHRSNNRSKRR